MTRHLKTRNLPGDTIRGGAPKGSAVSWWLGHRIGNAGSRGHEAKEHR